MGTRIEVMTKRSIDCSVSDGLLSKLPIRVFNIDDDLIQEEIQQVEQLLSDPIADIVATNSPVLLQVPRKDGILAFPNYFIEMSPKPGVNDPEGKVTRTAIENMIGREIGGVSTSQLYLHNGELDPEKYTLLQKTIGNPLIREAIRIKASDFNFKTGIGFHFPHVDLPEVEAFSYKLTKDGLVIDENTSDEDLMKISDERLLALNLEEMQAIRDLSKDKAYVEKRKKLGLKAMIVDAELECMAQTWSEHCCHKKFTGVWAYSSEDSNDESGLPLITHNILKSIIIDATSKIAKNIDWLVSVFKDNAGVIKLNYRWNISHKVETHNHPSALDGFGGSNTGTGGVIRDPLGTGIGMYPVDSQYGFGVAHPNSYQDLPLDIQSSARTLETVIAGVEDYGNKIGLPTACGRVDIDDGWLKPSIKVGCLAVAPAEINGRKTHIKEIKPGYIAISLGGRVGKDGIHGATASSTDLGAGAEKRQDVNQSVQIGDPIVEKGVVEVMDILQKLGYIEATQDCGAGGWNSALGELAELSNGAMMDLSNVPEKYKGLTGWEKLVSEAQERMVIVIKPENLERVIEICEHVNVEATKIAEFNDSGYYHVKDQDKTIVYLPMDFLHQGLPKMTIKAHHKPCQNKEPEIPVVENLTDTVLEMLARPNIQNYDWIMTRYDHEVQGKSLIKPLVGPGKGKSDAIAYRPVLSEPEVAITTTGSNIWQGEIDAYHMGVNNVVSAIGKIIAAGGNLDKITFNGNTTCPKPEKDPEVAAKVIRMLKGAADAEIVFGTPTISGKDSTSMQRDYTSTETGEKITIKAKPELLMSGLGIIPDDSTLTTCDFKLPGDLIYVIGDTRDELGASEFYVMKGKFGKNVPKSDLQQLKQRYGTLSQAIKKELVHSAQYIERGGLATALANSAIAGDLGYTVDLDPLDKGLERADKILFSETTGRFVITIHPSKKQEFEQAMQGTYFKKIGSIRTDHEICARYRGKNVASSTVNTFKKENKGEIRF